MPVLSVLKLKSDSSIPQTASPNPFLITKSCLEQLLSHHNIPIKFLDILSSFGHRSMAFFEGNRSGTYNALNESTKGSLQSNWLQKLTWLDITYILRYPERKSVQTDSPSSSTKEKDGTAEEGSYEWSIRQTGVYHRRVFGFPKTTAENFWILLHPLQNSKIHQRLENASRKLNPLEMENDPMRLHLLIFSSHVDDWRWYLHDMWQKYLDLVSCKPIILHHVPDVFLIGGSITLQRYENSWRLQRWSRDFTNTSRPNSWPDINSRYDSLVLNYYRRRYSYELDHLPAVSSLEDDGNRVSFAVVREQVEKQYCCGRVPGEANKKYDTICEATTEWL